MEHRIFGSDSDSSEEEGPSLLSTESTGPSQVSVSQKRQTSPLLTQRLLLLLLHPGLDLPYRCPRLIQLFQSEKLVGTQTRIQFEKSVWTSSQPPCM
ncbi:unnamed protein product [Gadus morhua 'NCC']